MKNLPGRRKLVAKHHKAVLYLAIARLKMPVDFSESEVIMQRFAKLLLKSP